MAKRYVQNYKCTYAKCSLKDHKLIKKKLKLNQKNILENFFVAVSLFSFNYSHKIFRWFFQLSFFLIFIAIQIWYDRNVWCHENQYTTFRSYCMCVSSLLSLLLFWPFLFLFLFFFSNYFAWTCWLLLEPICVHCSCPFLSVIFDFFHPFFSSCDT